MQEIQQKLNIRFKWAFNPKKDIKLIERYNVEKLKKILNSNKDEIKKKIRKEKLDNFDESWKQAENYLKQSHEKGLFINSYKHTDNTRLGRLFSIHEVSLQNMLKEFRHTITLYEEIDILRY